MGCDPFDVDHGFICRKIEVQALLMHAPKSRGYVRDWLWTAVTAEVTAFVVRLLPSGNVAQELLGERFWGGWSRIVECVQPESHPLKTLFRWPGIRLKLVFKPN
jgi:hypothetical protein